ncbi:MAG TPA: bifunctional phosphoribosylaminoimidazolecarboxamide formyltransferase/IMP cyclohydrolase [Candidatus Thalassarchaeaceae archaeon]|nr:bifunctional phosphoribosylaminoimidazolecarboxamide formyltransferase/IMP cyclohydrolase [Candidatus Thalassarchaeaceae archaeon]
MVRPRALLSVWDKEGITFLGKALTSMGWELVSTGGTSTALKEAGLEVTEVSEITNHPEIFDGRVKTLHPAVHSGILARRDNKDDMDSILDLDYGLIDLVCVNLYPFEATAAREPPASDDQLIEMIDIGGPTMVRSAAKNHNDVIILTSPDQYQSVIDLLQSSAGQPSGLDEGTRRQLAKNAFRLSASYDAAVSNELERRFSNAKLPSRVNIASEDGVSLRYGENPHQQASFYPNNGEPKGLAAALQISGKPLSYNNYLDLDGALRLARSMVANCPDHPHCCIIVKHTNPCGVAVDQTQVNAWEMALASDPESAFGCVIAFTQTVETETAKAIGDHFFECVIAPGFESDAIDILSAKANRRIISLGAIKPRMDENRFRQIDGGWLSQSQGPPSIDWTDVKCVTETTADETDLALARFGSTVVSEVKSNAIILISTSKTGCSTVGVGPGQTSRVEALRIAARRAGERASGSMLASDAFFPFRDSIDEAHRIGVTRIVQPGGSVRDEEVIEAANEHGISMLFTRTRQFLH